MPKVKVLTRNPDYYLRETKRDIHKVPRNYDPSLHPFEGLREYTRAINAVKLERVFAKPFVGNLEGHKDGISYLGKHPSRLSLLASGAYDGEIRFWDLPRQKCVRNFRAHNGWVRGIAFNSEGDQFVTTGDDKTVKMWNTESPDWGEEEEPINTYISKTTITGVSHHQKNPVFATCGEKCQIWEEDRNEPVRTFTWGDHNLHDIHFNPVEAHLLATCAGDRSIILYDMRDTGPVRRVTMRLKTNRLCWNPMEAFVFTCANEDYNLYTFDMRRLNRALYIHQDHVSAVTAIDYAPTGKEFVSGSYDKTIRIFESGKKYSREVYQTKRMQRLTSVLWSLDNKYVLSGSDEMNVRIWKARASEKLGVWKSREKAAFEYNEALKQKYASHPQVRRIARHRHVSKMVYNAKRELRTIKIRTKQKEENIRLHSKPGTVPNVEERKKCIVGEQI